MTLSPETGEAVRFLKWLDPDPNADFFFFTKDDSKTRNDRRLIRPTQRTPRASHPRRPRRAQSTRRRCLRRTEPVSGLESPAHGGQRRVDLCALVRPRRCPSSTEAELHLPPDLSPTLVVQSSPGISSYWLVEDFPIEAFRDCQLKLAELTGGDMGVAKNAAQGVFVSLASFTRRASRSGPSLIDSLLDTGDATPAGSSWSASVCR